MYDGRKRLLSIYFIEKKHMLRIIIYRRISTITTTITTTN